MDGDSLQLGKNEEEFSNNENAEDNDVPRLSFITLEHNILWDDKKCDSSEPQTFQSLRKRTISLSFPMRLSDHRKKAGRTSVALPLAFKSKKVPSLKSFTPAPEDFDRLEKKLLKRSYSCPQKFLALPASGGDNGLSHNLLLLPEKQVVPWKRRCTDTQISYSQELIPFGHDSSSNCSTSCRSSLKQYFCSKRMCLFYGIVVVLVSILTQHLHPVCDPSTSLNLTQLKRTLQSELHGQSMAEDVILETLTNIFSAPLPKRLLILLFIGRSGTGKTLAASLLSRHFNPSTVHSFSTASQLTFNYQDGLHTWITSHLSFCSPTLLIFDDLDENQSSLFREMDNIFKNWYSLLPDKLNQPTIIVLITSSTSWRIDKIAIERYSDELNGVAKSEINAIMDSMKEDSYSWYREVQMNTNFYIVPFLPLNRENIKMCIKDYLLKFGYDSKEDTVNQIADQMDYFPKDNPIFSKSGCKLVPTKIEMMMS